MKTTTNTRNTGEGVMNEAEEKAMALMLHLNNDFFECNGQLYQGTEERAMNMYRELALDHESFEDFIEGNEDIVPVDASLDAIEAEGYKVCTADDAELCKNVIGTEKVNDTMYFICMRENRTNNATGTPAFENNASIDLCNIGTGWVLNINTDRGDTQLPISDKDAEHLQKMGVSVYIPD